MAGMGSSAFRADLKHYLWKTFSIEVPEDSEQFISNSSLDNILDKLLFLKLFFFSLCSDVNCISSLAKAKGIGKLVSKEERWCSYSRGLEELRFYLPLLLISYLCFQESCSFFLPLKKSSKKSSVCKES